MTPVLGTQYRIKDEWLALTIESRPRYRDYLFVLLASVSLTVILSFLLRNSVQSSSDDLAFLAVLLSVLYLSISMLGSYHSVSVSRPDGTLTLSTRHGNTFIDAEQIVSLRVIPRSGSTQHKLEIELSDGRQFLLVEKNSVSKLQELAGVILTALDLPRERVLTCTN